MNGALLSNLKKTVVHGYNHNLRFEKSIENQKVISFPMTHCMYIFLRIPVELKNVDDFIINGKKYLAYYLCNVKSYTLL